MRLEGAGPLCMVACRADGSPPGPTRARSWLPLRLQTDCRLCIEARRRDLAVGVRARHVSAAVQQQPDRRHQRRVGIGNERRCGGALVCLPRTCRPRSRVGPGVRDCQRARTRERCGTCSRGSPRTLPSGPSATGTPASQTSTAPHRFLTRAGVARSDAPWVGSAISRTSFGFIQTSPRKRYV